MHRAAERGCILAKPQTCPEMPDHFSST